MMIWKITRGCMKEKEEGKKAAKILLRQKRSIMTIQITVIRIDILRSIRAVVDIAGFVFLEINFRWYCSRGNPVIGTSWYLRHRKLIATG